MTRPSQTVGSFSMQRVLVVGANGAGKTWLAQRLSETLNLPCVNNDALALGHDWSYRAKDVVRQAQASVVAKDGWVFEGGPSLVRPDVLARTQAVIWLDLPAGLRLWRILRRSVQYTGRTRPELPEGNVEWPGRRQFRFGFKAWANDAHVRARIEDGLAAFNGPVVRLKTRAAVRQFIEN